MDEPDGFTADSVDNPPQPQPTPPETSSEREYPLGNVSIYYSKEDGFTGEYRYEGKAHNVVTDVGVQVDFYEDGDDPHALIDIGLQTGGFKCVGSASDCDVDDEINNNLQLINGVPMVKDLHYVSGGGFRVNDGHFSGNRFNVYGSEEPPKGEIRGALSVGVGEDDYPAEVNGSVDIRGFSFNDPDPDADPYFNTLNGSFSAGQALNADGELDKWERNP